MRRIWMFFVFSLSLSLPLCTQAQDGNPFEYKEPEPKPEVPQYTPPPPNPNLSDIQKDQVAEMIKRSISELGSLKKESRSVSLEDGEYVVLKEGEVFSGISSGMFVVYSETTQEYEYFDSQKYKDIISSNEYEKMLLESKEKALSSIQGSFGPDEKKEFLEKNLEEEASEKSDSISDEIEKASLN